MSDTFHVAIVGGGLGGLALAIGLTQRSIPYTIYEARASFGEYIGAGINLGPNTLRTLNLIDGSLGNDIFSLCTRNRSGSENVWMQVRFGAPTDRYKDAELITDLIAAPTGNTTLGRNELLQTMARKAGLEHAKFDSKLSTIEQTDSGVTLRFADGTVDTASVVVACDGIHSAARKAMLKPGDPAAIPHYTFGGAYRAVLDMADVEQALGPATARISQLRVGPGGYIIMYPMENGQKVNAGFWPVMTEPWNDDADWVVPAQGAQMRKQFAAWGETAHKIMDMMGDPPFFATFSHTIQPESLVDRRVALIGDSAHSSPPHQGAGAGQAAEDGYVMMEVLQELVTRCPHPTTAQIEAALKAFEEVRKPRYQRVLETSVEAMDFWANLHHQSLTEDEVQRFIEKANERFEWIWRHDLIADAKRAQEALNDVLRS